MEEYIEKLSSDLESNKTEIEKLKSELDKRKSKDSEIDEWFWGDENGS